MKKEDKERLLKIYKFYTDKELAEIFGRSKKYIVKLKKELGIYEEEAKEVIPEGFKKCIDCKGILEVNLFSKNKTKKDGLQNMCRSCCSIRKKKTRVNDKDNKKDLKKNEYIEKHKEEVFYCNKCNEHKTISDYYLTVKKDGSVFKSCKVCKDNSNKKYKLNLIKNRGY